MGGVEERGEPMKSLVIIAPVAITEDLASWGNALGYDGVLPVRLSADGNEPATHLGAHLWANDEFIAIITGAVQAPIPGVDPADVAAGLSFVTTSVLDQNNNHFNTVASGMGLQRIEPDIGG